MRQYRYLEFSLLSKALTEEGVYYVNTIDCNYNLTWNFFGLMFLRTPIAISVGISCFTTCWYLNIPADIVIQNAVKGVNGYSLMAVPFFILMGEIMSTGGIAQRLVNLASSLVGWMRGTGHGNGGGFHVVWLCVRVFGGLHCNAWSDYGSDDEKKDTMKSLQLRLP